MKKRRTLFDSFRDAFIGIRTALHEERNMRIHFMFSFAVIALALLLKLDRWELVMLVLMIALVISLELINSALERIVDLIEPSYNPLAALAKRLAASAVLVAAAAAVAVGLFVFVPHLVAKLK